MFVATVSTGASVSFSNVSEITVALKVDRPEITVSLLIDRPEILVGRIVDLPEFTVALIVDLLVISIKVVLLVSTRCVENIFQRLITSDSEAPSQPRAEICPRRWFS